MRTKFKPWTVPYLEEHKDVTLTLEEAAALPSGFLLEVGSGKGKFLVDMAAKFPDLFFVGIEKSVTCAGITAKKLVESETPNAKIIREDMEHLLPLLPDKSVKDIFLNFSDPWPKKRHTRRRLTSATFLPGYHRILRDDGHVYFKTDNRDLFLFTVEAIGDSDFAIERRYDDYSLPEEFDTPTEYELAFREKGQTIYRLVLKKKTKETIISGND